ncbi:MAG: alanine dehydrogenase [Gemmatimonadetes bacterium]|jgi:alanine dehydrogenase|nr:alanine dehydrogenase [Gemmatimonadota bacterium]MBT4611177.1 alanine dehydrogenase [Gemmatimonadota bacterium]MBT5058713.1 alanine dehydrogenase [Gemmatimonadota bacterium]MBT5591787.1 alanine dehydrogenase [Gemmatimonadota bacterium]MBT5963557.1 alanine dehydrogenase [Gemmatimonadota bacterium]
MIVGVPKEIKTDEDRVGLLPVGARTLIEAGHTVLIEAAAGEGAGVPDVDYIEAGASVVATAGEIFAEAELIVKVKEPQTNELGLIREGQIVFTYFHFAASAELTNGFAATNAIAVAYETVTDEEGRLPLLIPMSEIAGRMAVQEGAKYLEKPQGGRGVLLGGLPGVAPADVVIIGAGVVGLNAARIAAGMGASVHLVDVNIHALRHAEAMMPANVSTYMSNSYNLERLVPAADLLICAVLVPGARAPKLVSRQMVQSMKQGAVIVDVAVDQGGGVETMRVTTHSDPVFVEEGVLHCGVANLPGGVPRTATIALNNATFPYVLKLANQGWEEACRTDVGLAHGLNIIRGKVTHRGVAEATGLSFHPLAFDTVTT